MVARMCHGMQVRGQLWESILAFYHRLLGIELRSSDLAPLPWDISLVQQARFLKAEVWGKDESRLVNAFLGSGFCQNEGLTLCPSNGPSHKKQSRSSPSEGNRQPEAWSWDLGKGKGGGASLNTEVRTVLQADVSVDQGRGQEENSPTLESLHSWWLKHHDWLKQQSKCWQPRAKMILGYIYFP